MKLKSRNEQHRQVVIALKGGGSSGKTHALRRLYADLAGGGAVLLAGSRLKTKNLRRYFLSYKRWRVVICEGGDTDKIIQDNFSWADMASSECSSCEGRKCESNHPVWDVIVMPAWIDMYSRDRKDVQGCVGALLKEVWDNKYSLEIVDRDPVPGRESDRKKASSQAECAKRLRKRLDFVIGDQFMV